MADKKKEPTLLERLLEIARRSHCYHTPEGEAFADVTVGGKRESWPVRSESFRLWLLKEFFEETKTGCAQEPLGVCAAERGRG